MNPQSPLLQQKYFQQRPVFLPENLMRETRRQKALPVGRMPEVCVLDPDGDMVRHLVGQRRAKPDPAWACYHTTLYRFEQAGLPFGIIGCAVGGPFAVLLAEQLFVSGCELLLSVTSAGQITSRRTPPYWVLIDQAMRDEGTSHHYLPPARYVHLRPELRRQCEVALAEFSPAVEIGSAWTTDAPYRETAEAIAAARAEGVLAVEMEAASLYAFAEARQKSVVCFAHITNRMGIDEGDFEKGEADGAAGSLRLVEVVARTRK